MRRRAVIFALWGLVTQGQVWAAAPVRIGVSLALTGRYAEEAAMQRRGYELWEQTVNAQGGVLGRPVQLLIRDDRGDPAAARRLYEELIEKDRVDLVFGPYASGIIQAVAPVTEARGFPLLVAGGSSDAIWEQGYRYAFGLFTPASRYADGFLELLTEAGVRDVGVLYLNEPAPLAVAQGAQKQARLLGLRVVHAEEIPKGASDLTPQLRRAQRAGAKVLLVSGYLAESVGAVRGLKKVGWRPDALFCTVGPALQTFWDTLGTDAEGTLSSSQWIHHPRLPIAGAAKFQEDFVRRFRTSPSYQAACAYAAGQILEAAIAKAGGIDRERIRSALASLNFSSIIGRYGVDQTGRQLQHFLLVLQWQKGKQEVVWPAELQTARPVLRAAGR